MISEMSFPIAVSAISRVLRLLFLLENLFDLSMLMVSSIITNRLPGLLCQAEFCSAKKWDLHAHVRTRTVRARCGCPHSGLSRCLFVSGAAQYISIVSHSGLRPTVRINTMSVFQGVRIEMGSTVYIFAPVLATTLFI